MSPSLRLNKIASRLGWLCNEAFAQGITAAREKWGTTREEENAALRIEVAQRRALAEATQLECNRLAAEVERLDAGWREANIQTLRNGLSAEKAEAALRGLYGALDKAFVAAYLAGSACDAIDAGLAALRGTVPRYAPGMNATDHKPHCDILTTRDGWDADCTCGWRDTAPREEKP